MYIQRRYEMFSTYELSQNYLPEALKVKMIQCSSRQKDSLQETIDSISIQYHQNGYVI